jgi:hypothetical protein
MPSAANKVSQRTFIAGTTRERWRMQEAFCLRTTRVNELLETLRTRPSLLTYPHAPEILEPAQRHFLQQAAKSQPASSQLRTSPMKTPLFLVIALCGALLAGGFGWLEAKSANAILDRTRKIRPQSTIEEVKRVLGTPSYTFEPPNFPTWLQQSAVGQVIDGSVIVYTIGSPPRLLIIHLTPSSRVQFVTWEPT